MLNASWDDISNTQQQYYLRKASEAITTALSVIHPGQENEIWNSLHQDSLLVENQGLEDSSVIPPRVPLISKENATTIMYTTAKGVRLWKAGINSQVPTNYSGSAQSGKN